MQLDPATPESLGALFVEAADVASEREVEWYAARLPRSGLVIDAMAGTGRLLVPLVAAGVPVHGAEASPASVARCRQRLAALGHSTEIFRQDVSALNLPLRYAAAIVTGGAFQRLVEPTAAIDALLRIRAHLTEPASLLLDFFVPLGVDHPPGAAVVEVRSVTALDGCRIGLRSETSFNVEQKRIDVVRRYERRERTGITAREDEMLSFTWYTEEEARALLDAAGFRDIAIERAPWPGRDAGHFVSAAHA